MEENSGNNEQTTNASTNQTAPGVQAPTTPFATQPPVQASQPSVQQPQINQQNIQVVSTSDTETSQEKPGGVRLRFSAYFFDNLIVSAPIVLIWGLLVILTESYYGFSGTTTNIMLTLIYFSVVTGYFVYFDMSKGATPGKRIYGLKVIDINSKQNLNFKNATIRKLVARVVGYIPLIGIIFSVINFFCRSVISRKKRDTR